MSDQPKKLDLRSHNVPEDRREELLRLFPEIRTEGGELDLKCLKLTLGKVVDVRVFFDLVFRVFFGCCP